MFRRMTLSIFAGALLAVVFAFTQPAEAACNGACPETLADGSEFDSCRLVVVEDLTISPFPFFTYRCYYTKVVIIEEAAVN